MQEQAQDSEFTNSIKTCEGLKQKSLNIQQRSTGTSISGLLLQEKAKHFPLQLHVNGESADHESFKVSTGWLDKFKNWHSIRNFFTFICGHWSRLLELKMCYKYFYFFCLHCCLTNPVFIFLIIQTLDYLNYMTVFTQVSPSPDNRSLTVY